MARIIASRNKVPGDLLVHMEYSGYCTRTAKLRNSTAVEVDLKTIECVGYPLVAGTNGADYDLMVAGGEDNAIALLVDGPCGAPTEVLPATTNGEDQYQVLKNAPCVVNRDKITTVDVAGDDFDIDAIVTALQALKFEFREEPDNQETMPL